MCPIFVTLVLLALVCGLLYLYVVWNFGYWRRRGFKEAKSYPIVGSFPSQFTQKRHVAYDALDIYEQFKKSENFVGVIDCRLPQILMISPEYARKVYVSDFRSFHDNETGRHVDKKKDTVVCNNPFMLNGEEWKERRAEITPGLTTSRISAVYPVTKKVCKNLIQFIQTQMRMVTTDGFDAKQLCLRFTTEVVSDCVLGIEAKSFTENPLPIYPMMQKAFNQTTFFFIYSLLSNIFPIVRKFYLARFFSDEFSKFFFQIMKDSLALRRQVGKSDRLDFINYLLELQDKKHLNLEELTSHTMTFLLDGFETTANTLAHTLLLFARNPATQERLLRELENEKDEIDFERLSELPYLDACIHETLRIFPALVLARKLCTEPVELTNKDGRSYMMKPGQIAMVPVYSLHHDDLIYPDPEEFRPERFLPENGGIKKYRDMGAFIGFGDGPRVCFGMRFALTQIKAAVVAILRQFEIKPNKRTRSDNTLDDTFFMSLLKGGIWLDFVERK